MPITREAIVTEALALADSDGLEALSMRAVAGRLGIQAMSLYHHIKNKAALLDALHERLILEMDLSRSTGGGWDDALREAGHAYRSVALAHPRLFVLLATRPMSTPSEFAHVTPTMLALERAGLSVEQQLFAIQTFFCSLNGYLLAEVGPIPGHPEINNPSIAAVDDDAPHFLVAISHMDADGAGNDYFGSHYEAYLNVLIAGLAASGIGSNDDAGDPIP